VIGEALRNADGAALQLQFLKPRFQVAYRVFERLRWDALDD
jgi:hypothetical protein